MILMTALLTGCVPYPHFDYFAPPTSGVIMRDGQPVAGATIKMKSMAMRRSITAQSDATGRFATPPLREFQFVTALLGDRFISYELDISVDGKDYIGVLAGDVGSADSKLILNCDLDSPTPRYRTSVYCTEVGAN